MSVFYSKTFSERTICISISACFQAEYESSMSRQWPYPKVPSAVFILTKITKDWRISKQKTLFFRLPVPNRILPYQKDVIVRAIRSGCPLLCFSTPVLPFYSSLSIWLSFIIVLLLPCDLSWTYFPAKVIGCSNLPMPAFRREWAAKIFLSVCRAYFSASALSDCFRHLLEAEK